MSDYVRAIRTQIGVVNNSTPTTLTSIIYRDSNAAGDTDKPGGGGGGGTSSPYQKLKRSAGAFPLFCFHKIRNLGQATRVLIAVLLGSWLAVWIVASAMPRNNGKGKLQPASTLAEGGALPPLTIREEPCVSDNPCTITVVADLDTRSAANENQYRSYLMSASLAMSPSIELSWQPSPSPSPASEFAIELKGSLSEAGRGMELSDLLLLNQTNLYAFDDRTGIVYEIMAKISPQQPTNLRMKDGVILPFKKALDQWRKQELTDNQILCVPIARDLLTEGDGIQSSKGMKIEWATQKDGYVYIGSFGKEYTSGDGSVILNKNNMWVAVLSPSRRQSVGLFDGSLNVYTYLNWENQYNKIRIALGASFPGYIIHEAVNWSSKLKKWVFLPRRVSSAPYDEISDETRGANKIVMADENFDKIEVLDIQFDQNYPERGFSSFKFIPGTDDKMVVALRSVEDSRAGTQSTYITILDIMNGKVLMTERKIPIEYKFEGVEIW